VVFYTIDRITMKTRQLDIVAHILILNVIIQFASAALEAQKIQINRISLKRDVQRDLRSSPQRAIGEPKCGTAEMNYHPCTSKSVANKLFMSCCELYVPLDCHFMCNYETDEIRTKNMLLQMVNSKCDFKYMSSILYCASQNRDNRQCCQDLDLNAPDLSVGSRCLRMCDPSGTPLNRITSEDITCLYNWSVILYCHHAGIREM